MKISTLVKKEFDAVYLDVCVKPLFWYSTKVNGDEDTESGDNIPCKKNDRWCPLIIIEDGRILNWELGNVAMVSYKVCDDGVYRVLDKNKKAIATLSGYVPEIMSPAKVGWGDYIFMDIDVNGNILKWNKELIYDLIASIE